MGPMFYLKTGVKKFTSSNSNIRNIKYAFSWWVQGERKISVLIGISLAFALHVIAVYWWYWNDDLLYPLVMLPPKSIPPFWHAIFIIMVNGELMSTNIFYQLKCNLFCLVLAKKHFVEMVVHPSVFI